MEKNKLFRQAIMYAVMLIFLSGCWDAVELEERAFLAASAVDFVDDDGEHWTIRLTHQFVVPAGIGTPTGGGSQGKAFRNLSEDGEESVIVTSHRIQTKANRVIDLDHLELIIVSRETGEKEGLFDEVLDAFIRYQHTRRGVLLAVAEGDASELLNVEAEHEKVPALYIKDLLENKFMPYGPGPIRVGDTEEKLLEDQSFLIPYLQKDSEKSIEYKGVALIQGKSKQMVGTLTGEAARGLTFILGRYQKGGIQTKIEGDLIVLDILESGTSKIKLTNNDKDNLHFDLEINLNANIVEYLGNLDLYNPKTLDKVNKALEDKIKQIVEDTLKQVKDEFQVDVIEFGEYLRMYHYDLWQEVKDNWDYGDNYFSKSDINVKVQTTITEPGSSLRLKKKEK